MSPKGARLHTEPGVARFVRHRRPPAVSSLHDFLEIEFKNSVFPGVTGSRGNSDSPFRN
jgi:hypothetical protein